MTTSLQRRSTNGNNNRNHSHHHNLPCSSSKGAFEVCFAQGLDLSEFGSSTTSLALSTRVVHNDDNDKHNNNNNINAGSHVQGAQQQKQQQHRCASAELLPMIQKRAQERHYNEQEEFRLHETIQRRAWNIQQELKGTTTTTTTSSNSTSTHSSSCTMVLQEGPVRHQNTNHTNTNTILTLADTLVSMHGRDDFGGGKTVSVAKTVSKATGNHQTRKHNQPKYNRTRNDAAQGRRRQQRLPATVIQSHGLGSKKGIQKSNRIKYY